MLESILFIFGTIFGSFYGVVIDRLPKGISISTGRSRCEYCDRDLTPLELIPIVSYRIQGGKCRTCHTKLSLRYPFLEILTGVAFTMCYVVFGLTPKLYTSLIFVSILIMVAFIDIDTMTIYDRFHVLILVVALFEAFYFHKSFMDVLIGSVIISVPLYLIALFTGGIGGGDIKLMFVSGMLLGVKGILVAFVIAVILGGVYGIYSITINKHTRKDAIPFGPFLCIGLFIAILYAPEISTWYLSLLGI